MLMVPVAKLFLYLVIQVLIHFCSVLSGVGLIYFGSSLVWVWSGLGLGWVLLLSYNLKFYLAREL